MGLNILLILGSLLFFVAVVKFFLPNLKLTNKFKNIFSNNNNKSEDENNYDMVNDKTILIASKDEISIIKECEWETNMFYENGEVRLQQKFLDEKTTFFRSFFENGKIESLFRYKNKIKVGRDIYFYQTGNIAFIKNFVDGKLNEIDGTEKTWDAELVLLSMGFLSPEHYLSDDANIDIDERGNYKAEHGEYTTSQKGIFSAGDCRRGQSLVVWAIRDGRDVAKEIDHYLKIKRQQTETEAA